MKMMSDDEFRLFRAEMCDLTGHQMLMITNRFLQPAQLQELDADKAFTLICGSENQGNGQFYCVARRSEAAHAVEICTKLIHEMLGGKNITVDRVN